MTIVAQEGNDGRVVPTVSFYFLERMCVLAGVEAFARLDFWPCGCGMYDVLVVRG